MTIEEPQFADQNPDDAQILAKLKILLAEIGYPARKTLPDDLPEYAPLKDKKVMMLDNDPDTIFLFLPFLCRATNGKAGQIYHRTESVEELAQKVMDSAPDYLLLDYDLSRSIKGPEIAKALRDAGYIGQIIGFSDLMEENRRTEFIKAGANDGLLKGFNPAASLIALAQLVGSQDK